MTKIIIHLTLFSTDITLAQSPTLVVFDRLKLLTTISVQTLAKEFTIKVHLSIQFEKYNI